MKIAPIQQNSFVNLVNINKQEKKEASIANIHNNAVTVPLDNYGRYLVNFRSGKSKAMKKLAKLPMQAKKAYAFETLSAKELLVISNNMEKAKKLIKENLDKINIGIRKIKYIQDLEAENVEIYLKEKGEKFIEFLNLNKGALLFSNGECVESGESINFDELCGLSPMSWVDLYDEESEELMKKYSSVFMKEESFEEEYDKEIKKLNQKIFSKEDVKAKKDDKFVPTFASVGGQDEAIKQLKKKLVYPIQHPEAYKYYKNKGVLLYGPPGTGKSLLAEAVGNEVNVSFFSVGGTDFKDKYVGGSEKAFEEQIQKAIDSQPSILFIDEVDSLARQRGSGDVHADSLLNKVLHSMTKLQGEEVYLIAATNNIDLLDKAFLRSGRFGAHIKIDAPDLKGTEQIFDIHLKDKLDKNLDKSKVIQRMHELKMVGADIAIAISEAYENAFERLGIEKAMDEGRYTPAMLDYLELTQEDFDVAFNNYKERNNKQIRKPIGFNKK